MKRISSMKITKNQIMKFEEEILKKWYVEYNEHCQMEVTIRWV